ncbi:TonB-dependent receptor [Sphingopyxis sp. MSC1_008]|jgi:iron complex outermembrane receptor protein|uniref:TonB-dependent receptor n=1 Tax=Sphingopyxis sp. MSC1_008 TaxID=2909265 RepID=UPI0020C0D10E|nr:TonB-dependent receptor [Sphingopyxis sp. MSC1_008]
MRQIQPNSARGVSRGNVCGLLAILALGAAFPPLAWAQSGAAETPQASAADRQISDIVVTAERRQSTVQDTPIAISAFEGAQLERQGIVAVEGLSRIAPGLQIYSEAINNEEFIIRGIGKSNEDLTTDSGVAVYLNDAYIPQSGEANAALFDIERVEVLRGPQGTLYGKNAVGGVINIITRKPTDEIEGYMLGELGSIGRRQFEAAVGGPVIEDKLSARIAGFSLHTDGAYRNLTTGNRANGVDSQALRGSLRFTPSADWEINLVVDYSKVDQAGVLKSVVTDIPGSPLVVADFFRPPYPYQEANLRTGRSDFEGDQGIRQWGAVLRIDHNADAGTATIVSSYRGERSYSSEDIDRTASMQSVISSNQKTWATSHEFRFVSDDDGALAAGGRLHWTAGLYWFHEEGWRNQGLFGRVCAPIVYQDYTEFGFPPPRPDCDFDNVDYASPAGLVGPGTPDHQDATANFLQRVNTDSIAAFGEVKFDVTDRLSISAGLRYTRENKQFDLDATSTPNNPGSDDFTISISDFVEVSPGVFEARGPYSVRRDKTWSKLTPKFVLEYEASQDLHAYASYARGFKSGGFNGQADKIEDTLPFNPEVADNFEVGLKADLFDRSLRINTSAFYILFDDLQVGGVDPITGAIITNNAAESEIKGLEIEALARPFPGLSVNGSLSLLDGEFKDYAIYIPHTVGDVPDLTIPGPPFILQDLSGARISYVPKYTATLGAEYEHRLGDGSSLRLGANATFKGNTVQRASVIRSRAYAVVDAHVGWTSPNNNWSITGWVRNLTDEVYYPGGAALPDFNPDTNRVALLADPRTYGATVKFSFGP